MQSEQIENTVVDEANRRTYIVLAPRVLSDGEIYRAIRREILKRGGEQSSPPLVADQGAGQPMAGPAQARSLPGEST